MAFRDCSTMQELLGPVITAFAEAFRGEPEVQEALRQKHEYLGRQSNKLKRLPNKSDESA